MTDDADDPLARAMQQQGHALRALARSILRGADGADDAVQDAAAAALTHGPRPRAPFAWLARVVRNFALRRRRDDARRARLDAARANAGEAAVAAAGAAGADLDEHERLARAVRALPDAWRRAIVLRFWHDLPPRAIAQQLGVPVATVKTHLQRGLAALRERLRVDHGGRDAWLAALVPIAHPRFWPPAAASAPLATAATTLLAMKLHHAFVLAAAAVVLTFAVWQPWLPAAATAPGAATPDGAAALAAALAVDPPAADAAMAPGNASAKDAPPTAATVRVAAAPTARTCTIVGRIVVDGDAPVPGARLRLENLVPRPHAPDVTAAAAADGTFAVVVPRPRPWVPYGFALVDAPGWATHAIELDNNRVQDSIADDRLDLGTIRLERGVAVAGRVVEPDGSPLLGRARLLAWDPWKSGSYTAMFASRTVGFVEPGGAFALADRLAAGRTGTWMLAAVSQSGVGWVELPCAAGQQHLDPVEIRLLPGGDVDVHVVDLDGLPLAGARVAATPRFQPIGLPPMWEPGSASWPPALDEVQALFVRRTDAGGRARFTNLPRRDHPAVRDANQRQRPVPAILMTASLAGFVANHAAADPLAAGSAAVTIVLARQRRIVFHGTVATPDGAKLAGVRVRVNGSLGGDMVAVTDATGRYELPPHEHASDRAQVLIDGVDVPLTFRDIPIPTTGERFAHDLVVEVRAPVTGRVVDQDGAPVAGVRMNLGVPGGMQYAASPAVTGADGAFAFPDAVASHIDLSIQLPEPRTAWRTEPARRLARRDGEVVVVHRLAGPRVDVTLTLVHGRDGTPASPTDVELLRLNGEEWQLDFPHLEAKLAFGTATVPQLPPGRYRAIVRGAGELAADYTFEVPSERLRHEERIALWPSVALTCTVDASGLPAGELAARAGDTGLVLLDSQHERSQMVDGAGARRNLTPNTGMFRFGGEMSFRLVGVTPNVARRLRVLGDDLFGEVWFTAAPGAEAHVTLTLARAGRLAFTLPAAWSGGALELDVRDGDTWRHVLAWQRAANDLESAPPALPRTAGATAWRLRWWPPDGGATVERSGSATIAVGQTTAIALPQ